MNTERYYESREDLESDLIENGEYEDGLKEWLENSWESWADGDIPMSDLTDEEIFDIELEFQEEYLEQEWNPYVNEEWEKELQ